MADKEIAAANQEAYRKIFGYDYVLGAPLPSPQPLPGGIVDSFQKIYYKHDYTIGPELPKLKDPEESGRIAEYKSVIADFDYTIDEEESEMLGNLRFLENLAEQLFDTMTEQQSQIQDLKSAVIRLQSEKQLLLNSTAADNLRELSETRREKEEMRSRLTAQILALADELDKERLDRSSGKDKTFEQVKTQNVELLSENRRLRNQIDQLREKEM